MLFAIIYIAGFLLCLSYGLCMWEATNKQLKNYRKWGHIEIPWHLLVAVAGFSVFPLIGFAVGLFCWVFASKEILEITREK